MGANDTYVGATHATTIMPTSDIGTGMVVCQSILLPLKWAADIVNMHPHPYAFFKYI